MSKKNLKVNAVPEAFEWPEYRTETQRIKMLSKRYKNVSIAEAFEDYYKIPLKNVNDRVNITPQELRVGSYIDTKILSIEKDRVIFDSINFKTNIQSAVNLYKYEKFKHYLPMDTIRTVVTRVDRDKVVVDPISPMIDGWLQPILQDPNIQKVIEGEVKPIKVKNLQLTRGGFMGKAVIPVASEFVGEDYTIDAFIPGSQIVLNITDNFEQFIGKTVDAFVVNYIQKPGTYNEMSLICSAKELIKFSGERNMIELFKHWCEETEQWKMVEKTELLGKVTGVINSSKKCGVFVEIPELSITGMVNAKPEELVKYKPHSEVYVKLTGFDEGTYYDNATQQTQHELPYEIENGVLKKCNLKPVLQFA